MSAMATLRWLSLVLKRGQGKWPIEGMLNDSGRRLLSLVHEGGKGLGLEEKLILVSWAVGFYDLAVMKTRCLLEGNETDRFERLRVLKGKDYIEYFKQVRRLHEKAARMCR